MGKLDIVNKRSGGRERVIAADRCPLTPAERVTYRGVRLARILVKYYQAFDKVKKSGEGNIVKARGDIQGMVDYCCATLGINDINDWPVLQACYPGCKFDMDYIYS